ncbi:hypothetical protein HanPI659440_Chr08g0304571 [Helianthus annuus]|nr:hypothetical protein HanPI659440_Chr08g0304571 [Helianthus annuus]
MLAAIPKTFILPLSKNPNNTPNVLPLLWIRRQHHYPSTAAGNYHPRATFLLSSYTSSTFDLNRYSVMDQELAAGECSVCFNPSVFLQ